MAGQSAGMIDRIQPAADIIREIFLQADVLLEQQMPASIPGLINLKTGGAR